MYGFPHNFFDRHRNAVLFKHEAWRISFFWIACKFPSNFILYYVCSPKMDKYRSISNNLYYMRWPFFPVCCFDQKICATVITSSMRQQSAARWWPVIQGVELKTFISSFNEIVKICRPVNIAKKTIPLLTLSMRKKIWSCKKKVFIHFFKRFAFSFSLFYRPSIYVYIHGDGIWILPVHLESKC